MSNPYQFAIIYFVFPFQENGLKVFAGKFFVFFLFLTLIFTLILTGGCKPEDGFCYEKNYGGDENFFCFEMDGYFTMSGNEISRYYTTKVLVYRGTVIKTGGMFSGNGEAVIEKPEYLPEAIPIESMVECTIAPQKSGMNCNEWFSFTFTSIDGISLELSSRKGKKYSPELYLKFITLHLVETSIEGTMDNSEVVFEETVIINEESAEITHKFSLYPK